MKSAVKKVLKKLNIDIHSPVKGIYRKDVVSFFASMENKRVNYVVLRWYDCLPYMEPGEDYDILVSNEDCLTFKKKLKIGNLSNAQFTKCDLYPVNNAKGYLAYYPPFLAEKCLNNKVKDNSGVWRLDAFTYFCALSYHAVFHKGYTSGLKSKYREYNQENLEHNYESILRGLAREAGIDHQDFSIEGLELFLKEQDWLPPLDIYFRRSNKNRWILDRLQDTIPEKWYNRRGLTCFVIRELADTEKWCAYIERLIFDAGAEVIASVKLGESEKQQYAKYTRGGDWGKGPSKVSGGLPSRIILARKGEKGKDELPHGVVEYSWVKEIKERVRTEYNKSVSYFKSSNVLHSTDNGVEASYYLSILEKVTGKNYEELL